MPEVSDHNQRIQTLCLLVLTAIATGAALDFLSPVMVPFVLAFFLTVVLTPVVETFRRRLHLPFILAIVLTGVAGALLLSLLVSLVSSSVVQLQRNSDTYSAKFDSMRRELQSWEWVQDLGLDSMLGEPAPTDGTEAVPEGTGTVRLEEGEEADPFTDGQEAQPDPSLSEVVDEGYDAGVETDVSPKPRIFSGSVVKNVIVGTANSLIGVMSQAVLVLIFMLFMVTGRASSGTLGDVENRIRGYVMTKVIVSSITGILVWLILSVLNVEMALVFGVFAFLLNFVPSVGSIISTVLPLPIVLIGDYSLAVKVLAIALPGVAQFAVGNFVEPKMLGDSMDLHPVTILLALIFWGMVWGTVGALLATPITAVLRILLDKEPLTRPVAELMAGRIPGTTADPAPS